MSETTIAVRVSTRRGAHQLKGWASAALDQRARAEGDEDVRPGSGGKMAKAWSLLTLEPAERQYVANDGYPDVLYSHYAFDSTVPNHGAVSVGDLAVLRDGEVVLGTGWIDSVRVSGGQKRRLRCPVHPNGIQASPHTNACVSLPALQQHI